MTKEITISEAAIAAQQTMSSFLPVKLVDEFMGLPVDSVFTFDTSSLKYELISEYEEIGPGSQSLYSGTVVAIDPYLVTSNLGKIFEYSENPQPAVEELNTEVPGTYEEVNGKGKVGLLEDKPNNPDGTPNTVIPSPDDELTKSTNKPQNELVLTCGQCGYTQVLDANVGDGLQIILTDNPKSGIDLSCTKCESHMRLSIRPSFAYLSGIDETPDANEPNEKPGEPQVEADSSESMVEKIKT